MLFVDEKTYFPDGGETVCYDGNEGTGAEGVGREDVFVVRALFQKLEVGRRVVLVVREA